MYVLLFSKRCDLGITKNYRGITLTSIAVKIYFAQFLNYIKPEIKKILWKNQNDYRRNRSTTSQILTIHRIIKGVRAKIYKQFCCVLFEDFSKEFDSIHRGKIKQILLAQGLLKETVTTIMMQESNGSLTWWRHRLLWQCHKSFARRYISTFFYNLPMTSIDLIKENGQAFKKARSWRYPAETTINANYADDLELLSNTPTQA